MTSHIPRHTLIPTLSQVHKWSYLGQFAAQIIENWQANSSIGNTPVAIKILSHDNLLCSSPHPLDFNMLVIFSSKMC